ncbi:acetyl/propionyl-CoA carboxylase alpha subunit/acetyl-CoA carboxylase carboxyltransferase component [Amycolatopsis lexingtonensis]|uniref:Acetyl/propionyl-CoA carboxylase alpha subunit/acetyl-CoA carboxylase carboxyltransferase component n=1 Tax=Amycolatopsis lexingtonensis TaxID=218822 RepID=A0ABR9HXU3_9PSEU|nr:carboxyl transferase domain-containing protein [Amycolatopsis lexingtonensis]MBE1495759.1 acetyl/propionyl-CoA carboxylase alpha subunit/acetyl-CoA carboxylase carboxyltransferase component [Amycolatopsis lexingtonensis]
MSGFHRVAVVNRGEPAMRFLTAAAELAREGDPLTTIALYTEPDRQAWFVREADEAVCLGPATTTDEHSGRQVQAYLDLPRLEQALVEARADAAWVGWGFVAEHAEFAELCEKLGVVFIGPSPEAMRLAGDKIRAKQLAERAGVPVVPWSGGPVDTLADAAAAAAGIGYPLLVKATAGGGGRGIRRVRGPGELEAAFESARAEARHGFGDASVFLERELTGARHVEVQVIADRHGAVWPVGLRDCSLQRRHQKVLEESACVLLDPAQEAGIRAAAARLCCDAGYTNAGTVEFLYLPATREYCFLEVNARLQVEHPVTELTTGLDLVKLQIAVARGERLTGAPPAPSGHAMEVRLTAEDPDHGFAPAPGRIRRFRLPAGPGVRVDTGVAEGDEIAAEFDSMIAKVLAWGRDREEARARLAGALARTQLIVEGGRITKAFLLTLLDHPDVVAGHYDTGWLDAKMATGELLERRYADIALVCAGVEAYELEHERTRANFYAGVARGRPGELPDGGRRIEFRYRGTACAVGVRRRGPASYRVSLGDAETDVEVVRVGEVERRLSFPGRGYRVLAAHAGPIHTVEVEGITHTIARDEGGVVRSPTPAVVVSVAVAAGDAVAVGDPLVVLESMKMETAVTATFPGRVRAVLVAPNGQVGSGAPLVRLDPVIGDAPAPGHAVPALSVGTGTAWSLADALRSLVLGFDPDPGALARLDRGEDPWVPLPDAARFRGEREFLRLFTDVCAVSRRRPEPADETGEEAVRAPEEYLLTCLRTYGTGGEGLPPRFLEALLRVLGHHGITKLGPSAGVADALLRLYRGQHRLEAVLPAVAAVLDRWIARGPELARHADDDLRELLDRLVEATDRRYPAVMDLARDVRFRCFEQPVLVRARARLYREMDGHIAALATGAVTGAERGRRMAALVACPQPLRPLLLRWYRRGGERARDVALEVSARRYYRIRDLGPVDLVDAGGVRLAVAGYRHRDELFHLVVGCGAAEGLDTLADAVGRYLEGVAAHLRPVLDLHVWAGAEPDETLREHLRDVLAAAVTGRALHRADVTVSGPRETRHWTFRSTVDGLAEEPLYRDLHPMLAKRLNVDRLSRFAITRLDSAEDVYLFHGVAHDNPKDERLFALAEVRDLTPVTGEHGEVLSYPALDWVLGEVLSGLRRFQSHRPPGQRLLKNVVLLHVRPPWTVAAELWRDLGHRLAPSFRGLGVEHVLVRLRVAGEDGGLRDVALDVSHLGGVGIVVRETVPSDEPIAPLGEYDLKALRTERRGDVYPYELIRLLTPPVGASADFPPGEFTEYDFGDGGFGPVDQPPGGNTANLVTGLIRNHTTTVPEGMARVLIAGDPSRSLGALAEPECRRIVAALDLAERLGVPVEWFAVSSGARISMTSGTENMDWIGAVLRRIITFTQGGGEINIVVTGINVGAQPYWNAEATMLMHTRGVLVMLPESAMVLTGKQALDFSGGVSAEDNLGIGGFERIMGPNGQAQYRADDLESACEILFAHYEHTYVVPGERFPRRARTADPFDRDVRDAPHPRLAGTDFTTVGDIFSPTANPERKKPFAIRAVLRAVADDDHRPLERWARWKHADTAVVQDAHLGGIPVCLIGFESHPVPREDPVPGDGPAVWTAGTLFPQSSKKVARAINAASGNRPVVVLANLSGFDGSPESMRSRQLEYGAEIGRAVTNFAGPIVFAVVSRYHGGAFVVFSKQLNENLEVAAVEGSYASVIGGAPAAAVVFAREVRSRTRSDPRVAEAEARRRSGTGSAADVAETEERVRAEKLGEVAAEFDETHDIGRARDVGSVDHIIPASELRPYLIAALERGLARCAAPR